MKTEAKKCQSCKKSFIIDSDDFNFYEKMSVPPPTWCWECRMLRRFVFRNVQNLFRRKEAVSGKEVFSSFSPEAPEKVYELDYWNSDAWDPMEYGREYDFSRPFFEQFREFMYAVPWPAKAVLRMVNSDYCNQAGGLKNCYLCFNGDDFENSAYVITGLLAKDSFDLYEARHTELSYEGYMIDESYKVFYSVNCEDCHDVWFSRNMVGCQNCFGCINLRNKSYYLFNKQVSKDEYKKFMEEFASGSHEAIEAMKLKVYDHWKKFPEKYTLLINVTNATGEHIERSKNIKYGYGIHEGENIAYSQNLDPPVSDSYDYTTWGSGATQIYESLTTGEECDSMKFTWDCWPSSKDVEYSISCRSSSNLFGCVGLQKKKYCIFNKQYSKEEYEELRERIINHMNEMPYTDAQNRVYRYGEFFPPEFSPFAYNETIAQDFFPLTKEEAEDRGYVWREPEAREYETTMDARGLPDDINEVSEDILKEIIKCSECKKAYRIIEMEFNFLKRLQLPIPRLCVRCRFKKRLQFVNPPKFRHGRCHCSGEGDVRGIYTNAVIHPHHGGDHCPNKFETSYSEEQDEILYCEQCYQQEVI